MRIILRHGTVTAWCSYAGRMVWFGHGALCTRKRGSRSRFYSPFWKADSEKLYRVGNVFIADVRSFTDIRRNFQQSHTNAWNSYLFGMGFLLLNIFLGLLGTFWFRTQQRRGEIALMNHWVEQIIVSLSVSWQRDWYYWRWPQFLRFLLIGIWQIVNWMLGWMALLLKVDVS